MGRKLPIKIQLQNKEDPRVLNCQELSNNEDFPILQEEVEAVVRTLKCGKAVGIDNIPADLLKHGGETVINVLTIICNKFWQTSQWPLYGLSH